MTVHKIDKRPDLFTRRRKLSASAVLSDMHSIMLVKGNAIIRQTHKIRLQEAKRLKVKRNILHFFLFDHFLPFFFVLSSSILIIVIKIFIFNLLLFVKRERERKRKRETEMLHRNNCFVNIPKRDKD